MKNELDLMAEIVLDLDTLVTLTNTNMTPKVRGFMAAARIERYVRELYGVRMAL